MSHPGLCGGIICQLKHLGAVACVLCTEIRIWTPFYSLQSRSPLGLEGHRHPGIDDFQDQGARKGRMGVLRQCCILVKYAYGVLLISRYLVSCSGASLASCMPSEHCRHLSLPANALPQLGKSLSGMECVCSVDVMQDLQGYDSGLGM